MKKYKYSTKHYSDSLRFFMYILILIILHPFPVYAIDLSDSPPEAQVKAAPPNFMIGLDDSGSMDWETLCQGSSNGYFQIKRDGQTKNYAYVLPNPGDNLYSSSYIIPGTTTSDCTRWEQQCVQWGQECVRTEKVCTKKDRWGNCIKWTNKCVEYKNVCQDYNDVCLEYSGSSDRGYWRSQWSGPKNPDSTNIPTITTSSASNQMYYNPNVTYLPWLDENGNQMSNADPTNPKSHPVSTVSTSSINLDASYATIGSLDIKNAHYYVWSETEQKAYLVIVSGGSFKYYYVDDNKNGIVTSSEISEVTSLPADVALTRTYTAERQNFANWYTFYRKRWLSAAGALTRMIPAFTGVKVGVWSINDNIKKAVVPVNLYNSVTKTIDNQSGTLVGAIKNYKLKAQGTPLRTNLKKIGTYIKSGVSGDSVFGTSPRASNANGGACQQNFALVFTDGYWNDSTSPGVGNTDGDATTIPAGLGTFSGEAPYADDYSDTLADVAMYFYKNDLDTTLDNIVPTNIVDKAQHQHLVTYSVGFGLEGTLDHNAYDFLSGSYPTWPQAVADSSTAVDDLWHTAVNGRGSYLSAKNPTELLAAFQDIVNDVQARTGSAAAVSMNGTEVNVDLTFYQSLYSADKGWIGDVVAKTFPLKDGKPDFTQNPTKILWNASDLLNVKTSDNRVIVTNNGSVGIPFRYDSLSSSQKTLLNSNATEAGNILNYLRGDHSKEIRFTDGVYRNRADGSVGWNIGDIVHSAPVYYDSVVYAGANDGMLHAFAADNGRELFAYVPNLVFANLNKLSSTTYSHIPYVDSTGFAKKVVDRAYYVSGLGKGGKGVFCLDITNVKTFTGDETAAASFVKWEFPSGTDNDMGYSFSKPSIINTAAGWMVVFGNGYNSVNKKAVLYVVNLATGALVKKINTNVGTDNGLSTPSVVDVNGDGKSDYIYAGDLEGNMWKFDITSATAGDWSLAYGTHPLFTAKDAAGKAQPITSRPDVMLHCQAGLPGYIVVFGTGKYLGSTDLSDKSIQTIYGIWDYGDDADDNEYLGTFTHAVGDNLSNQPSTVSLLKQEVYWKGGWGSFVETEKDDPVRILTDNKIIWLTANDATSGQKPNPSNSAANHAGWYFDLPVPDDSTLSAERVVNDVMIRNGNVIVVTTVPGVNNPCIPEGTSWLYEINACSGGRGDTHLDTKTDGKLNNDDLVEIDVPDPNNPGHTIKKKVGGSGLHFSTLLFTPVIARQNEKGTNKEIKFGPGADGVIRAIGEPDEQLGIYYWRSF